MRLPSRSRYFVGVPVRSSDRRSLILTCLAKSPAGRALKIALGVTQYKEVRPALYEASALVISNVDLRAQKGEVRWRPS